VYGYYLRAKLLFADPEDGNSTRRILCQLRNHQRVMQTSPMQGIPELTNENGSPCADSCPTQAWSMSCCLDALYDAVKRDERFAQQAQTRQREHAT
jgi:glycogen debranching enzyme